ncbi:MAG TPA: ATP-binding cassette domain-containing protein, partial [Sphingomonas sp.]|nr:ATP-binding cassette domain-containing protein [Sphingomonas sp.]
MSELLAFCDVSCARGGRTLFEGLSFTLAPGATALVSGPNGVGKSSLIRVAAGLLAPVQGVVEGEPMRSLMAEAPALDSRPLAQALLFWAKLDASDDPKGRVARALDATALAPLAEVPVRLLSTGQRRRAALA